MTLHELKCWPEYLALVASGAKTFEVRECRDRTFREGDSLILRGYDPESGEYTGQVVRATIGYVLPRGAWGLPKWKTVFSLLNVEAGEEAKP